MLDYETKFTDKLTNQQLKQLNDFVVFIKCRYLDVDFEDGEDKYCICIYKNKEPNQFYFVFVNDIVLFKYYEASNGKTFLCNLNLNPFEHMDYVERIVTKIVAPDMLLTPEQTIKKSKRNKTSKLETFFNRIANYNGTESLSEYEYKDLVYSVIWSVLAELPNSMEHKENKYMLYDYEFDYWNIDSEDAKTFVAYHFAKTVIDLVARYEKIYNNKIVLDAVALFKSIKPMVVNRKIIIDRFDGLASSCYNYVPRDTIIKAFKPFKVLFSIS